MSVEVSRNGSKTKIESLHIDLIPNELRALPQWVCWRYEHRGKDPKPTKPPIRPSGDAYAKCNDPATWGTFDEVLASFEKVHSLAGVGFVFTDADPYSGVDLDDCREDQTGIIDSWARLIIERLHSYTEVSPSGTGVKIWIRAKLSREKARNRRAYAGGEIEMYSRDRYFTVTSQHLEGTPFTIESRQRELDALYDQLFAEPHRANSNTNSKGHRNGSRPDSLSDREMIDKAMAATNGAKFKTLWNGDTSDYASPSEADLALCTMLAFWTGKDETRIDALFRQSRLMRLKWERSDYRDDTIAKAIDRTRDTYHAGGNPKSLRNGNRPTPADTDGERAAIQDEGRGEPEERLYIEFAPFFLSVDDPPMRYLIDELLPEQVLALLHGEPRTRKSWAALDLAIAIATGTAAFGMERFRVSTPLPVLYSSQEDTARVVRLRAKALLRGRGIDQFPPTLAFAVHKGIDLESGEWIEVLVRDVLRYGFKLITFDPIRRYGLNVDKGPADVQRITAQLRRLSIETGVAVQAVHHDVKPAADNKDNRRRGHKASGGDWFAASECPIAFESAGDSCTLIRPEDYKLSGDPESFQFRLETDNSRHPTLARLIGETVSAEEAAELPLQHNVLEYVRKNPHRSTNAIEKGVKARHEDVAGALENLLAAGKVDCIDGKRGAKLWFSE
jgi:putative DNA primase/helicase